MLLHRDSDEGNYRNKKNQAEKIKEWEKLLKEKKIKDSQEFTEANIDSRENLSLEVKDKIIGYNNYSKKDNLSQITREVYASNSKKYYIVFDPDNKPKDSDDLLKRISIFGKTNVISINLNEIKSLKRYLKEKKSILASNGVIYFPEFNYGILSLEDNRFQLLQQNIQSFKIYRDKEVNLSYPTLSLLNENETTITKTETTNHTPLVIGPSPDSGGGWTTEQTLKYKWGIERINAHKCAYTGEGVNVAILDTGFDIDHPDFKNRGIKKIFSLHDDNGQDNHGHGTHCAGIACGYKDSESVRYGVAYESNIFICKVLDDNGKAFLDDIISGIIWALLNNCDVISISIEIKNDGSSLPDYVLSNWIQYAYSKDCITVAAAGNQSNRPRYKHPISSPADCKFALAISAINNKNEIFSLSNWADPELFQTMNLTAPGVDIYSSWSRSGKPNKNNHQISGTSMATPFIAGIVALLWEANRHLPYCSSKYVVGQLMNISSNGHNWDIPDVGKGIPDTSIIN